MNPLTSPRLGLGLTLLLGLLAGCSSVEQRVTENAETFAQLPPEVQQTIRAGHFSIGFTPIMVYMALGKPSEISTSADGKETIWTYIYFNTPEGELVMSPEVQVGTMPTSKVSALYGVPVKPMAVPSYNHAHRGVAGGSDIYNGHVRAPNAGIREATGQEVISVDIRQDLLVKFRDGYVTGFELVRI